MSPDSTLDNTESVDSDAVLRARIRNVLRLVEAADDESVLSELTDDELPSELRIVRDSDPEAAAHVLTLWSLTFRDVIRRLPTIDQLLESGKLDDDDVRQVNLSLAVLFDRLRPLSV